MLVFQIWSVATGALFLFLAWRTYRFAQNLKLLSDTPATFADTKLTGQENWPKVSVVIPACNEGETIEWALDSLLKIDYPKLEIILVDDRSTDPTGQIIDEFSLMDPRITPIHVNYLPPGWLGKVNALERGMAHTQAEWVLLTDADVHLSPDVLKRAIAYCVNDQIDFMTIVPDVITKNPWLTVIIAQLFHQASLFFNPRKINDPKHRACYGQGAFMLLKRSTYLKSEKMQWLKMEVVDDTGLALLMRRAGAKMAAVAGQEKVQLEWYPSLGAFLRGIEKNAFAFCQYSLGILFGFALSISIVFLGFALAPWLSGRPEFAIFTLSCLGVYMLTIQNQLSKIMHLRSWTVLAFPLAFIALPMLLIRASLKTIHRGGVNWRGTFYDLKTLKANQRMKLANLVFSTRSQEKNLE